MSVVVDDDEEEDVEEETCGTCSFAESECECCSGCDGFPCICCDFCSVGTEDHETCESCYNCTEVDGCHYCEHCGTSFHGWFSCSDCESCDNCGCLCDSEDTGDRYGTSEAPPWVARGIVLNLVGTSASTYLDVWGFTPGEHDPVKDMADFYLLAIPRAYMPNPVDQVLKSKMSAIDAMRRKLIVRCDDYLHKYVGMACIGEIRYHSAIGPRGPFCDFDRTHMWAAGKQLIDQVGEPQVWRDIAGLFTEMGDGSIGGPRWAAAATVLAQRGEKILNDELFCDRVFSMQHNGGSLLNKVNWKYVGGVSVDPARCTRVGEAHSSNPPDIHKLRMYGSKEAMEAWDDIKDLLSAELRRYGGPRLDAVPTRPPVDLSVPHFINELRSADPGEAFEKYVDWRENALASTSM